MKNLTLINPNHDGGILAIFSNIFMYPDHGGVNWFGGVNLTLNLNPYPEGGFQPFFRKIPDFWSNFRTFRVF